MLEKVTLEPLKKIWDLYQSIRLKKSVSKMGLMHLICWTNDHVIKKHWNFQEKHDFPGCGFSKFSKSPFFDFWPLYPVQFFARIFTVATRNWFDEANDGLWQNYIFFIKFSIFSRFLLRCKKPWKKHEKTGKGLRILAIGGSEIIIWC